MVGYSGVELGKMRYGKVRFFYMKGGDNLRRWRSCYEKEMENALNKIPSLEDQFVFQFSDGNRYGYAIDFGFPKVKLAIECDGEAFHLPGNSRDKRRDAYFVKRGWETLRFPGQEITNNLNKCITKILTRIKERSKNYV